MLNNNNAYKYETPYMRPFVNKLCFTNDIMTLYFGGIKIRYNICRIKPYTSDENVECIGILRTND